MTWKSTTRLNVTLDSEHAAKLSMLAERTHVQEGTLARSLLSSALDEADPDPRTITALLDGSRALTSVRSWVWSRPRRARPSPSRL